MPDVSRLHYEKLRMHSTSPQAGIAMGFTALSVNAIGSIRGTYETDTYATDF
jgi:hypothetical protein